MKYFTVLIAIFCASALSLAKNREWQDATITNAETGRAGSIAVGSASGTQYSATAVGIAAPLLVTYYTIETKDLTYVIACVPRGTIRYRCPNVTVHGHTHVAVEGRDLHVLDEDNKDRKLPIIEKIVK
jgi:hypothetical protein